MKLFCLEKAGETLTQFYYYAESLSFSPLFFAAISARALRLTGFLFCARDPLKCSTVGTATENELIVPED